MKVQDDIFRITYKYVQETIKEIEEKQRRGDNNQEVYSILEKLLLIDEKLAVVTAMDLLLAGVDTVSWKIGSYLI